MGSLLIIWKIQRSRSMQRIDRSLWWQVQAIAAPAQFGTGW